LLFYWLQRWLFLKATCVVYLSFELFLVPFRGVASVFDLKRFFIESVLFHQFEERLVAGVAKALDLVRVVQLCKYFLQVVVLHREILAVVVGALWANKKTPVDYHVCCAILKAIDAILVKFVLCNLNLQERLKLRMLDLWRVPCKGTRLR